MEQPDGHRRLASTNGPESAIRYEMCYMNRRLRRPAISARSLFDNSNGFLTTMILRAELVSRPTTAGTIFYTEPPCFAKNGQQFGSLPLLLADVKTCCR